MQNIVQITQEKLSHLEKGNVAAIKQKLRSIPDLKPNKEPIAKAIAHKAAEEVEAAGCHG